MKFPEEKGIHANEKVQEIAVIVTISRAGRVFALRASIASIEVPRGKIRKEDTKIR